PGVTERHCGMRPLVDLPSDGDFLHLPSEDQSHVAGEVAAESGQPPYRVRVVMFHWFRGKLKDSLLTTEAQRHKENTNQESFLAVFSLCLCASVVNNECPKKDRRNSFSVSPGVRPLFRTAQAHFQRSPDTASYVAPAENVRRETFSAIPCSLPL